MQRFCRTSLMATIITLTGLAIFSCRSHKNDSAADQIPPCEVTTDLDNLFSNIFPEPDDPGAIIMVMRRDTIVYSRAFGLADLETQDPVTDSTIFNLSSASKTFTAAAILKLCEQRKLSLEDTLYKYFPEFNNDCFKHITIRHILTHSSGLPDLRPRNQKEWSKYQNSFHSVFALGKDYALFGDEDEHINSFKNIEATEFEPGTHYERNDPAYILVAPLIERITGMPFENWMTENIFKPAGLTDMFYYTYQENMPKVAHAYRKVTDSRATPLAYRSADGKWDEYDLGEAPFFLTRSDRGVYGSARDFMQWYRALYSGKIISDSSLKAMAQPCIPTDIPMVSFGLGTAVRHEPDSSKKSYHMNTNGGYAIVEGTWPKHKLHYIVFANRADWNLRDATKSIDSIFHAKDFIR